MTVAIVSHDISAVSQHVHQVICVNRGVEIHPSSTISGNWPACSSPAVRP